MEEQGTVVVDIMLCGWIAVAVALFAVLPAQRAVLVAYLAAWLFLPQASIDLPGLPNLDKIVVTSMGALLGVLLFDGARLQQFRLRWVDIPMLVWIVSFLPATMTNEPPPDGTPRWYDAASGFFGDFLTWGVPYLIGRLYFNTLPALRELAIGIIIGGLIYVPLCLYEIRMSPQLHRMLYGFHPSHFAMTVRYDGYRPMVFMQHGLMVGMWMTCAALAALWLWRSGSLQTLFRFPMWMLTLALFGVTVLCKSTGALVLLAFGVGVFFVNKRLRSSIILAGVVAIVPVYMILRTNGYWAGDQMIAFAQMLDEQRAWSLEGRLENEDLLIEKASRKPWFGWGGWGRWRVFDETGKDITVSDGLWVIVRGERGLLGLASLTTVLLLPFVLLLRRAPARMWSHPAVAAPAALAVLLVLFAIDSLFNAMLNPILIIGAGGICGFYVAFPRMAAMARQAAIDAALQRMRMQRPPHVETAA